MALIANIREAASGVGVQTVITNSNEALETQLRRLNKEINSPTLLISWDMDKALSFNDNGYLNDPKVSIVSLLLSKPEDLTKEEAEKVAEEMGAVFEKFLSGLYQLQSVLIQNPKETITSASYKLLPRYGIHKHAGVLGKFTVADSVSITCTRSNKYTLTLSSGGNGTIGPFTGASSVNSGTVVTISSSPDTGYIFDRYTITTAGSTTEEFNNEFDIVVDEETFVSAKFILE